MRRGARIALLALGSPAIAASLFALAGAAVDRDPGFLGTFPFLVVFAYLFAAIPSLLFAVAMEVAFARGLDPASRRTVWLAAALGLVAGAAIALLFGPRRLAENLLLFAPLGAATGAVVSAILRARSRRPAPAPLARDPAAP